MDPKPPDPQNSKLRPVSKLRAVFNEDAAAYDAIRPGYPAQLVEDVFAFAQLPAGGRILEVGCGTGQASLPFAQRGYGLLCIDIGAEMLAIARQKLAAYPRGAFEDWPLEPGAFDLFLSATAFHWVPREVGYPKAAAALKPGGTLAIMINEHPRRGRFFEEVQAVYARHDPGRPESHGAPDLSQKIREQAAYIDSTGAFTPVRVHTYPWQRSYTTAEYLALLNTYSDIRAMPPDRRAALLAGIADLMEQQFAGRVLKEYLAVLYLAKRR